jgi:hypothetical protein
MRDFELIAIWILVWVFKIFVGILLFVFYLIVCWLLDCSKGLGCRHTGVLLMH